MPSQTKIFSSLVDDFLEADPPIFSETAPIAEVLARMTERNAPCVLVVDEAGALSGIFTEKDVTHRVALRCDGTEEIRDVMSAGVSSARLGDYLYHAITRMRRFGHRHMPVLDEANRPVGLLNLDDAMSVAAEQTVTHIDALTQNPDFFGLKEVKSAQMDVAQGLLEDSRPAPEIQALLTQLNREVHARVAQNALDTIRKEGGDAPPVRFSLIVMGSTGRGENFINPDQDHGIVLEDYPVERHDEVNAYFIRFAELLTSNLEAIGFPLCAGNVMATNPLWRKSLSEWKLQTLLWFQKRDTFQVQLSDVFFDFDAAWGETSLAQELRDHITAFAQKSPLVLQAMFECEADRHVALGLFGRLRTEAREDLPAAVNLKHGGILPLVGSVRLLALRKGIKATSTRERIALLHETGVFNDDEADEYKAALEHLTRVMLRQQLRDFRRLGEATRYVGKSAMSRREKHVLAMSLRAIRSLQERVRMEFTAQVL